MIRVNLLPQKAKKDRRAPSAGGQKWLLVVLGVLGIEIIGLFLFHQTLEDAYEDQKNKNDQIQADIQKMKKDVADQPELDKKLDVLKKREDAIAKLQAARTGPTAVMLELAQLLTPGKGPTTDPEWYEQWKQDNPLQVYNPAWDTRRLWLTSYQETERVVRVEGLARDSADVSEFAYRLRISPYFFEVGLLPGEKKLVGPDKIEVVSFAIEMKVRY